MPQITSRCPFSPMGCGAWPIVSTESRNFPLAQLMRLSALFGCSGWLLGDRWDWWLPEHIVAFPILMWRNTSPVGRIVYDGRLLNTDESTLVRGATPECAAEHSVAESQVPSGLTTLAVRKLLKFLPLNARMHNLGSQVASNGALVRVQ